MNLYKVKVIESWEYVIEVDEGEIPSEVAQRTVDCSREYDSKGPSVKVGVEIKTKAGLPKDWDINCLPWGTDDSRSFTINDILSGNDE